MLYLIKMELKEIYDAVTQTSLHKYLSSVGFHFNEVIQYGLRYNIDEDQLTSSLFRISNSVYYAGVCPCMQLEFGLYFNELLNLEYSYVVNVRAYIESVARVHKAATLVNVYKKTRDKGALSNGSIRLVAAYHKKDSSEGNGQQIVSAYGIMTLIDSLTDVVPDIRKHYDQLSEYLHGDLLSHKMSRKITYFQSLKQEPSNVIKNNKLIVNKLEVILQDDLEFLKNTTLVYSKRLKDSAIDKMEA
jgi:hypothetical protein